MRTKVLSLGFLVVGLIGFAAHAGRPQKEPDIPRDAELKEVATTLPSGEPIRMCALKIDRNWETSMTHLAGNVQVTIRESVKAGDRFFVVRADEASLNEKSGELTPIGNVRITQEVR